MRPLRAGVLGPRVVTGHDHWLGTGEWKPDAIADLLFTAPGALFEAIAFGPRLNTASNDGPASQNPSTADG